MKKLKFIHITKTAGTSIKNIGYLNGELWGAFHKEYGWHHKFFPLQPIELKTQYDWFTVVRNPYSRMVSEFYCNWASTPQDTKDVFVFNDTIQTHIINRISTGDHWSEQYKYIDNYYKIHVLKFENLFFQFNNLMKLYNLNIKLELNFNFNKSKKFFSPFDLSRKTLDLINDVYSEDFKYFNYTKI